MFVSRIPLFETPFAEISFTVGPVTVYLVQVVILLISLLLMVGLSLWLSGTRAGESLLGARRRRVGRGSEPRAPRIFRGRLRPLRVPGRDRVRRYHRHPPHQAA